MELLMSVVIFGAFFALTWITNTHIDEVASEIIKAINKRS